MLDGIHHLTFVVRDLASALRPFERQFGITDLRREELPARGVRTARFRAGATWIVFVQPIDDGIPARRLREHGEGLLLVSFGVGSLADALATLAGRGVGPRGPARVGVDGWRIVDVETAALPGTTLQLCEVGPGRV